MRNLVELLRRYSKLPKLTILIQIKPAERPGPSLPRSIRRRLGPQQVDQLCADYQAGQTTRQLSEAYGIGKTAVTRLLREQGVPLRHQGLSPDQVQQAAELYQAGQSVAQVASALGFHPSSVYDTLKRAGVQLRDPHAPGRRGPART